MISRRQLHLERRAGRLWLKCIGKGPVTVDRKDVGKDAVELRAGQLVNVRDRLLLLVRRQFEVPDDHSRHPFGELDHHMKLVGESAAAWALRDRARLVAQQQRHVAVLGESGVGKELVARGIHALSPRSERTSISRNAATLVDSLASSDLFGNVADYPNPNTPERPGLVGAAHQSTLILDEIAEISEQSQSSLLRFLDTDGEYTPLGLAHPRRADVFVVALTNKPLNILKPDLARRFTNRVEVPPLRERREDIPLILRHLLRLAVERGDPRAPLVWNDGEPRVTCAFVQRLLEEPLPGNVRELDAALLDALAEAEAGRPLDVPSQWSDLDLRDDYRSPQSVNGEELRDVLGRTGGDLEATRRELDLKDRFVLLRLRKKFGLMKFPQGGP